MTTELKPCPWCGEVPPSDCYLADENQGTKWGSVVCQCGIRGPEVRTGYDLGPDASWHESAARDWNTRATAAPVVVGEDMVERAWMAWAGDMAYFDQDDNAERMRAALTAALAGDAPA